jgi:FixJ family two-component response regulator
VKVDTPIKVAVIDDDESARSALARLLRSAAAEASAFSSAEEFMSDPICQLVDCALTDLRMPGVGGLELQQQLSRRFPYLSVVFITGHGNVPESVKAMKAGAVDFLEKPASDEYLLSVVHRAAQRSRSLRATQDEIKRLEKVYALLTPRERQVFAMVTAGMLNKQIGFELGTSEKTIKVHRARVMEKMEAGSLADLVRMAQSLAPKPHLAISA